jgi:4'-phosphopantetheinyl transferase
VWYVFDGEGIGQDKLDRYRTLLTDDERARCDRYRVEPARRQFLIARALVRTTLSRYVPMAPADWRFVENEYGRPEIATPALPRALRFNLSHTAGLVACAVAWQHDVGLDVEWVQRRTGGVHLAKRFFSTAEVADLLQVEKPRQRDAFFDYWTLKEAYIKARGMGLAIPLAHFSFRLQGADSPGISFAPELNDEPSDWQFEQHSPSTEHKMALAIRRGSSPDLRVRLLPVIPAV